MKQDNAIEVKNVTKKFKIYLDKGKMLKERAISWSRNKYEEKWVLNGISFEIKKGEAVGLIGHNGCGKSTTLKLLTKIMYPDSGSIEIQGRVSSLLELGAGFHPDMSGRENIYINASIFGLNKKEIDKRIGDIIAFSELEEYIDNPVRTYSSGMYMRLAFSVAINVNADVLLIDEILAVGDVNFQAKCFNKLMEIKRKGTTIVLVSHSTGQIEQLCERSIWIQDGLVRMDGPAKKVDEEYLVFMGEKRRESVETELAQKNVEHSQSEAGQEDESDAEEALPMSSILEESISRPGTGEARFTSVKSLGNNGQEQYVFSFGEDIRFRLNYKVYRPFENAYFGLTILRNDGVRCYGTNGRVDEQTPYNLYEDGFIDIIFPNALLMPGRYFVDVCIATGMDDFSDYWGGINDFEVVTHRNDLGVTWMPHEWKTPVLINKQLNLEEI